MVKAFGVVFNRWQRLANLAEWNLCGEGRP